MYILTERQKLFAAGVLIPIPASMYCGVFDGEHDIAFTVAVFLLARAARSEKEVLRDVVSRILLMSCKNIISVIDGVRGGGRFEYLFEVLLNGDYVRLRAVMLESKTENHFTVTMESEDV